MARLPFTSPAHDLLPAKLAASIPRLGETSGQSDPIVHLKWFTPTAGFTWGIVEADPESGVCYGLVHGLEREWGTFSLDEIQEIRGPLGLPVERDLYFQPAPASQFDR
jgi:hypothetical protein